MVDLVIFKKCSKSGSWNSLNYGEMERKIFFLSKGWNSRNFICILFGSLIFCKSSYNFIKILSQILKRYPTNNYLFKFSNRNTKVCWNLTIKTPDRRQWRRSVVFIVNFGHISHLFTKTMSCKLQGLRGKLGKQIMIVILEYSLVVGCDFFYSRGLHRTGR